MTLNECKWIVKLFIIPLGHYLKDTTFYLLITLRHGNKNGHVNYWTLQQITRQTCEDNLQQIIDQNNSKGSKRVVFFCGKCLEIRWRTGHNKLSINKPADVQTTSNPFLQNSVTKKFKHTNFYIDVTAHMNVQHSFQTNQKGSTKLQFTWLTWTVGIKVLQNIFRY